MPPKKKGKKGKKGKKKGKDGELTEDDKLKLKIHEVDSLKDTLALRKDLTRKTKAAYEEMKDKLEETNNQIEEIENIHKQSSAYLTYQYKTMQNELTLKNDHLMGELNQTKTKLEWTETQLHNEKEEKRESFKRKTKK